jgi:RodZ C-terminal domain
MLVAAIVGVLVVLGIVVAAVVRRRSHDDEHSVEHYHRQLHTLEELRGHPSSGTAGDGEGTEVGGDEPRNEVGSGAAENGEASYPVRAFRVSGTSTVRLTDPGYTLVPPVPPPPVPDPAEPVKFDDDFGPDPVPATFMTGNRDKAMHGINHRPRRVAGPIAAVAAVLVLIVLLILTGLHSNPPAHHHKSSATPTTGHATTRPGQHHRATTTTTTTAPPAVSGPQSATAHGATYQVSSSNYSLVLAATAGECWVEATNAGNGSVLFTATLAPGQSHPISALGPVTVIAGAPGAFAATVNDAAVALPPGNQAPFTLHFVTPGTTAATGTTGTGATR